MTQEALARRLGVSFPTVNIWERGHREPKREHRREIEALAADLGVRQDLSIVVIDDNPADCKVLQHRLKKSPTPAKVEVATNGTDGLLLVGSLKPDILFLDIRMPGFDGIQVADRVQATPGLDNTYTIFVTSLGDEDMIARARATGATTVLKKPVRQADLDKILEAVATLNAEMSAQVLDEVDAAADTSP